LKHLIVQIYEIQTPAESEALIELGVDHIGSVVLSEKNWKDSELKETIGVVASSTSKSSMIPLFSDPEAICRVLDYYRPDIVHFCENLADHENTKTAIRCQENVRRRFPEIAMMRSIPVPASGSPCALSVIDITRLFEPVSDYFLTDTLLVKDSGSLEGDQPVNGFVGITGRTCDWDIAARLTQAARPVILAGGISPDNVFDGILRVRPAGVDSCTLTNARGPSGSMIRFKKDLDRVRRLVQETRRAERFLQDSLAPSQ